MENTNTAIKSRYNTYEVRAQRDGRIDLVLNVVAVDAAAALADVEEAFTGLRKITSVLLMGGY